MSQLTIIFPKGTCGKHTTSPIVGQPVYRIIAGSCWQLPRNIHDWFANNHIDYELEWVAGISIASGQWWVIVEGDEQIMSCKLRWSDWRD